MPNDNVGSQVLLLTYLKALALVSIDASTTDRLTLQSGFSQCQNITRMTLNTDTVTGLPGILGDQTTIDTESTARAVLTSIDSILSELSTPDDIDSLVRDAVSSITQSLVCYPAPLSSPPTQVEVDIDGVHCIIVNYNGGAFAPAEQLTYLIDDAYHSNMIGSDVYKNNPQG